MLLRIVCPRCNAAFLIRSEDIMTIEDEEQYLGEGCNDHPEHAREPEWEH